MKKYDEYGIEQGTLNLTPYIVLGIIIFSVLIGLVILLFNIGNITKYFTSQETKKEEESKITETKVEQIEGLYVPKISNGIILDRETIKISLNNVEVSSKGYILHIEIKANNNLPPGQVECYRILIDDYDITGKFKIDINPGESKQEKITLKKTELEHLGINNFLKLTFYIKLYGGEEIIKAQGITNMQIQIPVNNEKKGLTEIYDKNNIKLSYYKKIEDEDYTYLYFKTNNTSNDVYNISLNKLTINDKLYEDTYTMRSLPSGKQISYMKIPKEKVENVDKIKISFFLEKETSIDKYQIHISAEKEIKT